MSRDKGPMYRGRNPITVHGEQGEQLLPGIPDEITLGMIAPRLPWTALCLLSSVCHGWERAIQSHRVYDARVRSKSTQTVVALVPISIDYSKTILLCSMEDFSCHRLPPIPDVAGGYPYPSSCQCISLDGRLYLLGGVKDARKSRSLASANVYVLDIAGGMRWEQCASMKVPRMSFGCGVRDGKIFVFGGRNDLRPVRGSEIYDPKEDAWSPITAISSVRFGHDVTTVGEELFLHSGKFYASSVNILPCCFQDACFAEVYHPLKNEWRILEHFTRRKSCWEEKVLTVGGIFHRLNKDGIEVYDIHANSWGPLQPFSFAVPEPSYIITNVYSAIDVDDEVLALVAWRLRVDEDDEDYDYGDHIPDDYEDDEQVRETDLQEGACLIRSQGFGGKETEIVWHRLKPSIYVGDYPSLMYPVQL